jgi:hypothetical protein
MDGLGRGMEWQNGTLSAIQGLSGNPGANSNASLRVNSFEPATAQDQLLTLDEIVCQTPIVKWRPLGPAVRARGARICR